MAILAVCFARRSTERGFDFVRVKVLYWLALVGYFVRGSRFGTVGDAQSSRITFARLGFFSGANQRFQF
ncbi:MAG: hypothetical protein P8Y78_04270 [Acidihalobacter sp.]